MARLRYVEPGTSPDVDRLYAKIGGLGRPVLKLYSVLANEPAALEAFLGMSAFVRDHSALAPELRELVILATAHELGEGYELDMHEKIAKKLGVAPAKIAAATGGPRDALEPAERAAVEFAREVARSRTSTDAAFERLRAHFSDDSIVDIVVTAAWYHLCAAILGALAVDREA